MSDLINVAIHRSQFPESVLTDLRNSLCTRQINPKFHYASYKQTEKWLELHQALSPSRNDPSCATCYDSAFAAAVERIGLRPAHVVGLGCGGGHKDTRLLSLLRRKSERVSYTPVDASTPMVLAAHQTASEVVTESHPLVCDLLTAEDLASIFRGHTSAKTTRLITFFGMIPNFQPELILPKLAGLLQPGELLLLSANLVPGNDYVVGVQQILPLYDNVLTRKWLLMFLFDLGFEETDGSLEWTVEACPSGNDLLRITAWFHFDQSRSARIAGENMEFGRGEKIRLFFSYRYTPERVHQQLTRHGLVVQEQWITDSGEEGVFLCERR